LKLHKILKDLGMEEKDVAKVLELTKHNELERLQWKVEYQIKVQEDVKFKAIEQKYDT
jgi:hypothetical protein